MIYLELSPAPPLDHAVKTLWYTRIPGPLGGRERVLPNGCVQIVINLANDCLHECADSASSRCVAPSLVVGARTAYEIIDRTDMSELMGIVFRPAGFAPFAASHPVDLFSGRSTSLEDVWGTKARSLRGRLAEASTPILKLAELERFLVEAFPQPALTRPMVAFAIDYIAGAPGISTVSAIAAQTGWSMRRFSQVFREQTGLTPKAWCRVQRFQCALRRIHAGCELPWSELALDCGYYDQSHFANDFRAFSGIDATTYSAKKTQWANHVPV